MTACEQPFRRLAQLQPRTAGPCATLTGASRQRQPLQQLGAGQPERVAHQHLDPALGQHCVRLGLAARAQLEHLHPPTGASDTRSRHRSRRERGLGKSATSFPIPIPIVVPRRRERPPWVVTCRDSAQTRRADRPVLRSQDNCGGVAPVAAHPLGLRPRMTGCGHPSERLADEVSVPLWRWCRMMEVMTLGPPERHASVEPGSVVDLDPLLSAVGRGDQEAFARLYDATSARVFGLVLRVLRDRAQAEEATQEVYLEVWRSSPRFDTGRGAALSWLTTIAHRKAVDRVRSAQAQRRRDTAYERREQRVSYDVTAEEAQRHLDGQQVRGVLGCLSQAQRGALELAYFDGLTHREVADRLGLPLGTAKTRIRDGLTTLRETLGGAR